MSPVKFGEMLDVVERDDAFGGDDLIADFQLGERLAERMRRRGIDRRAVRPAPGDGGEQPRRALHRRALHVMFDGAHAAEFFAAARAARAAMHETRQRRAVPGRAFRARPIADEDAAVLRRKAKHELARNAFVVGEHGGDQRSAAAMREIDRFVEIVVGHQRRNRSEGFDA